MKIFLKSDTSNARYATELNGGYIACQGVVTLQLRAASRQIRRVGVILLRGLLSHILIEISL